MTPKTHFSKIENMLYSQHVHLTCLFKTLYKSLFECCDNSLGSERAESLTTGLGQQ